MSRDCICNPAPAPEECKKVRCKYGNCIEWKCRSCHKVASGIGPLYCKCDMPRDIYCPEMAKKSHPPVKENKMRKQKPSRAFR